MTVVDSSILPANTNQAVAILRPIKELINTQYLFYFLKDTKSQKNAMRRIVQSVQTNLSLGELSSLEVSIPSLPIQIAIGNFINNLDTKIAMNNALSKTLEDIAQTIFKSWFIDFDPVKAKMAGEKPEGMDSATAALFPDAMEESELGLIPKGWNIKVISDFGKVVTGKTPSTKVPEYWGDQIPFVTIPDMHGQILVTSTARALSKQGADSQRSQNVPAGSTMVTCIATPGLVGFATKNCQTNQQINSVIPGAEYSSEWLFWHLRGLIPTLIRNSGIGTVFANLNKSDFSKIKSITPSMELRNAFNDVVEPVVELLETLNHESQYLRDIRDGLLPRLISGELQIPEEMLAS
jgi:type I restriction enzyme S subunit